MLTKEVDYDLGLKSLKGHRKVNIKLVWDIDEKNIPIEFWKIQVFLKEL